MKKLEEQNKQETRRIEKNKLTLIGQETSLMKR
jgi:hypothetical protein